jgi:hypothetical protein
MMSLCVMNTPPRDSSDEEEWADDYEDFEEHRPSLYG